MSKLVLSEDLEHAILHAIINGVVDRDVVTPGEVSKVGRAVLSGLGVLASAGVRPPFSYNSVLLSATEVLGSEKSSIRPYLQRVHDAGVGVEVGDILQKVREKQLLVDLVNEAAGQLQRGSLDVGTIGNLLQTRGNSDSSVQPISERIKDGLPDPPRGLVFGSLPKLARLTGGIIGVWALAGQPGVGKSTLAWQLALDLGRTIPVVYYDFENGFAALMDHTRDMFKGDLAKIRNATQRIYHRDSIRTLDSDLGHVAPPALVVVDSIQKLPGSVENRRHGLDRWIHRLEYLKKRGYFVLLISEIGRGSYDADPHIGAFKETGEIEYSCDAGIQLVALGQGEKDPIEVHIVKNRHKPYKGLATHVVRKRGWVFRELDDETQHEDID